MPDLPLVGTDFAGYRLLSVLGRGGMSIIYQAENPRLRNLIALKVLAPNLASDAVFRTRFREESRIAAALNHPNVIPIHDFGSCDGLLYIAMRYVPGTDLGRLLADHGRLAPGEAVYLLEQAARALDAAHARGLVHRDVKPGNLLIAQGGETGDPDHVYLADFGITKYMGARTGLTVAGTVLGTVHYVSPEQIQDQTVFGAADQYSLGCVLYECLTGRAPFEKSTNEAIMWGHVQERPVLPTVLRHDLPPAIDEVIARVLAKDPHDRYANCREFIADARDALAQTRPVQSAPAVSGGFPGPVRPAPVRSGRSPGPVQPAPASSGGFSGPVQPTVRDRRTPTANAVVPGRPADRRDSGPPHSPDGFTDFRRPVEFSGEPALVRRRVRRPRSGRPAGRSVASLVVVAACAAVIAGAGTAAGLLLSKTGDDITPASHMTQSAPPPGSLAAVLSETNRVTNLLPMSTCVAKSSTLEQCTDPNPAIASVSFETFPSLDALYTHYQEIIGNLAHESPASVENKAVCGPLAPDPTGESTWNHSDNYYTTYSVAQLAAGKVSDDTAMGRVFCEQTSNGSEYIVWTQDSGHLLGYATGALSHHQVWNWFYKVHHMITFPGQAGMTGMPGATVPATGAATAP